ncbi:hypothetical protein GFL09_01265 [Pseudomonas stutzeri]|uniref:zonular occludens toxin domain-containing protein n=1 Tax=Stutzerimonas stutzeri TaxID=316 RepID=UPI00190969D7|nr:zonular occludens toxin domain-containing protein [Stutzerimonas stutzeri]MBK3866338.1 hypothetical protein [Stutzerimonas stutzeri]
MINLMLGQPGGGKSHEAVVFHLIPALKQGRKVITNLALVMDKFMAYFPEYCHLIEIREPYTERYTDPKTGQEASRLVRPFSQESHYGDPWRQEETGTGPLYIIDECHLALPVRGTPIEVEEWYSLHRHEGADVLLITQSYGKLNRAIRDLVQVVYRCKKATAFGTNDRYIRKVQDGLRGEVVNTSIRQYEKTYFGFWKSHTRSSAAAAELQANDIVPIWKRWPFKGAAIMFAIAACMIVWNLNRDSGKQPPAVKLPEPVHVVQVHQEPSAPVVEVAQPRGPDQQIHPYQGYDLFLSALMKGDRADQDGNLHPYLAGYLTVTQNGQPIRQVSFRDLTDAGYTITYESPTVIGLEYKGHDLGYVVSALPTVSLAGKTPDKAAGG